VVLAAAVRPAEFAAEVGQVLWQITAAAAAAAVVLRLFLCGDDVVRDVVLDVAPVDAGSNRLGIFD